MSVYEGHGVTLHHGDCLDVLRTLPDASVDSVVTDPPYNLSFMGKGWDTFPIRKRGQGGTGINSEHAGGVEFKASAEASHAFQQWCEAWATECLRILKPGGYLISAGGSRTYHRMTCAVEDAGFEIRDCITWHFGSGFPKSRNVSLDLSRLPSCACDVPGELGTVDTLSPAGTIGAGVGAEAGSVPLAGLPTDAARRVGPQVLAAPAFGGPDVDTIDEEVRRQGLPVVLGSAPVARPAQGQEVVGGIRVVEVDPEALRYEVVSEQSGNRATVCAGAVPSDDPSGHFRPASSLVLPLATAPGGVTRPAEAAPVVLGHAGSGAVGRGVGPTPELGAADDADVDAVSGARHGAHSTAERLARCEACGGLRGEIPQGLGTALKPATEFFVVARKPLVGAGVNVLGMVESGLRNQGIEGEIRWTTRPASGAASQSPMPTSGSTSQQPTAATSARDASASETPPIVSATASATETSTANGEPQTPTKSKPIAATPTGDSATPSSTPTAPTAPAAAKRSRRSSRSTTSTAAAPSTESQSTERSTPNSAARDSQPDTESFAGIATGLTGSWATVRIDRLADGTFVWPDGLPPTTAGGSTVAGNVLQYGTGALNIDACRVEGVFESGWSKTGSKDSENTSMSGRNYARPPKPDSATGRWPANVVLDESQAAALDEQSGPSQSRVGKPRGADSGEGWGMTATGAEYDDLGGASRFFYVAKAPANERPRVNGTAHPTVKPLDLMRWLVRLVTPPGGTVLEPFAGSGTTVEACIIEGFQCIAIEREADYLPLIRQRIDRRRDPVEALRGQAADLGLFDLLGGEGA